MINLVIWFYVVEDIDWFFVLVCLWSYYICTCLVPVDIEVYVISDFVLCFDVDITYSTFWNIDLHFYWIYFFYIVNLFSFLRFSVSAAVQVMDIDFNKYLVLSVNNVSPLILLIDYR